MGQIGTLLPKPPYPLRIQWQMVSTVQTLGVRNQISTPLPSQVGRVILEVGRGHLLPPPECFGLCLWLQQELCSVIAWLFPNSTRDRKTSRNRERRTAWGDVEGARENRRSMHCLR